MNDHEFERGVTQLGLEKVIYFMCKNCGMVTFERETNPYLNMACSKNPRTKQMEILRQQLSNKTL